MSYPRFRVAGEGLTSEKICGKLAIEMQLTTFPLAVLSFLVPAVLVPLSARAQTPAQTDGGPVKTMSLSECIRSALERNLSIQVGDQVDFGKSSGAEPDVANLSLHSGGRLAVQGAEVDVHRAYGYYDPFFTTTVGQNFDATPGGFDPQTGQTRGDRSIWQEHFLTDLSGALPTGGKYDLTASGARITGTRVDNNTFTRVNVGHQYRGDAAISLTQPLLKNAWIDAGRLLIKLSKKDLKITELAFQTLVQDVLRRVALAYFELLAAREQVKVQTKALELAQQLLAENKKKVEVGTLAPLDEKQAESQAAKARADVTAAVYQAQLAENLLKSLITHDFGEVQSTTIDPSDRLIAVYQSFSLPESWRQGLENRPDYLQAKAAVERQKLVLLYRRNQIYPSLDLSATYGRNGIGTTTHRYLESIDENDYAKYGGGITLSFPLSFRNERDSLKKSKIDAETLVLSLKRREDLVKKDIDDALKGVYASYATTQATHDSRVYAEAALEAEQKKLENGKSTSFNVLQFQRDLTDAASKEIKALSDYNKSLHQLYFNTGTTLERNKVTLDLK